MRDKIKRLKLSAYLTLALVIGVGAVFGGVKAFQSNSVPRTVIENVENYNEAPELQAPELQNAPGAEEELLGAVSGPDLPNPYCVNNECTYVLQASFNSNSTTLVSFVDPFLKVTSTVAGEVVVKSNSPVFWTGATSTVDLVRLYVTGAATTTMDTILCGSASTPVGASHNHLLGTYLIPTGTKNFVLENGSTSTTVDGLYTTSSVSKIMLTPIFPYFNCLVTPDQAVLFTTTSGNDFAGKAVIRVHRLRY